MKRLAHREQRNQRMRPVAMAAKQLEVIFETFLLPGRQIVRRPGITEPCAISTATMFALTI
jgi:hypothetical protein